MKLLVALVVSTLASIAYAEDPIICGDQLVRTYAQVISQTLDGTEGNATPFMIDHYKRAIEAVIHSKFGDKYSVFILKKYEEELPPTVQHVCHFESEYYLVIVTKTPE